jgi:glycosyltransferase involved in cell wall biosynthesis
MVNRILSLNIHIYPSDLKNETRILKIVRSLRSRNIFDEILVIGRSGAGLPPKEELGNGIYFYRLNTVLEVGGDGKLTKFLRTIGWYFTVLFWLRQRRIDCLNCHSLSVLPLSILIKLWKRCALVYDTHELETETYVMRGLTGIISKLTEKYLIKLVDAVCVVNKSIANWYKDSYGLEKVWVAYNKPYSLNSKPRRLGKLRSAIGAISKDDILFIYQGLLSSGRGIEIMLDVFSKTDSQRHLVFMGYGPKETLVREAAIKYSNIHFVPAVTPDLIKEYTVDADIGLCLIENSCLSYYLCAPNKIYEYASSGLPMIVSDFPEMASFVDYYDCGWKIRPTEENLARLIKSIDLTGLEYKRLKVASAVNQNTWEKEEFELLKMYQSLKLLRRI